MGTFEVVLDRTRSRTQSQRGPFRVEAGIDAHGAWSLGPTDVPRRLVGVEAVEPNANAWIAMRSYLAAKASSASCALDDRFSKRPTVTLAFSLPELGNPSLAFDLETAALLAVTRTSSNGSSTSTLFGSWSPKDEHGVRWPIETTDKQTVVSDTHNKMTHDQPGLVCAKGTGETCLESSRPQFSIRFPASGRVRVPMDFYMNEIVLKVRVNGKETLAFLDSGAGISTLDATMPLAVAFRPAVEQEASSATQKIQIGFGELESVSIGELAFSHLPVASVPIPALADAGAKRPELILGYSLFEAMTVRIDYRKKEVIFAKGGTVLASTKAIIVHARDLGGTYVVDAKFEGVDATYEIDTGNNGGFDLYQSWLSAHLTLGDRPTTTIIGKFSAGTEDTRELLFRHKNVTLGPIQLTDGVVRVSNPPGDGMVAGLVGNGILSHCTAIVFDLQRRTLAFEPPCNLVVPETRSGFRLVRADDAAHNNRPWIVRNLIPGGAGAAAGLRDGDRVLEVDKRPAVLDLDRFKDAFEQPAGAKVDVVIDRGGEIKTIKMILRDILKT